MYLTLKEFTTHLDTCVRVVFLGAVYYNVFDVVHDFVLLRHRAVTRDENWKKHSCRQQY